MHVQIIPNRGSTPTVLLRESYREGSRVCKRTLANLSGLAASQIESIRAALRGEELRPVTQTFEITRSLAHGHVQAVQLAMKRLAQVERAFLSMKMMDLKVRPIHHHLEGRVRAHIFLCMLAYYVEWHMREAWAPLMFADEDQAAKLIRDPVAPAKRSDAAMKKACSRTLDDGTPVHSLRTLIQDLQTIVRNSCKTAKGADDAPTFDLITTPTAKQKYALELIDQIKM